MKKITFTILICMLAVGAFAQATGQQTVRYNQYGSVVDRMPVEPEVRNGILVFESAKQDYRFWFDIRTQLDGAVFFGEKSFMNPISNGASVRRARIGIKAQITRNWYGEIDTDFANGVFELKDALIRYNTCNWEFSAGNFKEDFSMEQITTSRYLPFMERPMAVQTFAPSRHLGIDAKYRNKWFYGSAGLFFQAIEGADVRTWIEDDSKAANGGHDQGISTTARLVFNPIYKDLDRGVHIGFAGSYRTPKTDFDPDDGGYGNDRYDTRNSTSINRKKYIDTDRIANVDYTVLWGLELAGHYRGFRAQGEFLGTDVYIKDNVPATVNTEPKRFKGWYAMAGYMLFGGEQRYNSGDAKYTQPTRGRAWGDLELLVRYDYLDLNSEEILGGSGQNFTVGLNYYVNNNVKFVLNYQYSMNDRYANGKGKFNVGRDADGNATPNYANITAEKGKGGVRYSMLGMRMEVNF